MANEDKSVSITELSPWLEFIIRHGSKLDLPILIGLVCGGLTYVISIFGTLDKYLSKFIKEESFDFLYLAVAVFITTMAGSELVRRLALRSKSWIELQIKSLSRLKNNGFLEEQHYRDLTLFAVAYNDLMNKYNDPAPLFTDKDEIIVHLRKLIDSDEEKIDEEDSDEEKIDEEDSDEEDQSNSS